MEMRLSQMENIWGSPLDLGMPMCNYMFLTNLGDIQPNEKYRKKMQTNNNCDSKALPIL